MNSEADIRSITPWRIDDRMLPALYPDRKVWLLRLVGGSCDGLWSDVAWFAREGTREHHWIRNGPLDPDEESVEVFETTVGAFLNHKHLAMNPFFSLARAEAMQKWRDYWRGRHEAQASDGDGRAGRA